MQHNNHGRQRNCLFPSQSGVTSLPTIQDASCSSEVCAPASRVQCCGYTFFSFSGAIMLDRVVKLFHEYEERLPSSDFVPRFSYGRRIMRDDRHPNRYIVMYLSQCNTFGPHLTWSADRNSSSSSSSSNSSSSSSSISSSNGSSSRPRLY